jgi:hypothetical protein
VSSTLETLKGSRGCLNRADQIPDCWNHARTTADTGTGCRTGSMQVATTATRLRGVTARACQIPPRRPWQRTRAPGCEAEDSACWRSGRPISSPCRLAAGPDRRQLARCNSRTGRGGCSFFSSGADGCSAIDAQAVWSLSALTLPMAWPGYGRGALYRAVSLIRGPYHALRHLRSPRTGASRHDSILHPHPGLTAASSPMHPIAPVHASAE